MDDTLKDVFNFDIKVKTNEYNNLLEQFTEIVEKDFDKSSIDVECLLLHLLSRMIKLKSDIKDIEIALMFGKEEE